MGTSAPAGRPLGDLHSHLVPGVDDGAPTADDALEGVGRMMEAGVGRIVTTPHLDASLVSRPDAFRSRMDEMDRRWEEIRASVAERFPDLSFHRGHEVMLDVPDPDLSDTRLHLADTRFVLVEWPALRVPTGTGRVVSRIRATGLVPVIAHPERYHGLDPELELPAEWRRLGARLQVSHGSLVGRYGPEIRKRAFQLLRRADVDYLSTDFHGRPRLRLHIDAARTALEEAGAAGVFETLTATNPARLLRDEDPLPAEPVTVDRGLWNRLVELFVPGSRMAT